jgi:arginyl-tRNA synthetase
MKKTEKPKFQLNEAEIKRKGDEAVKAVWEALKKIPAFPDDFKEHMKKNKPDGICMFFFTTSEEDLHHVYQAVLGRVNTGALFDSCLNVLSMSQKEKIAMLQAVLAFLTFEEAPSPPFKNGEYVR